MVRAALPTDEASILTRAIQPERGDWPTNVANAVLALALSDTDRARMNELAARSASAELSPEEEEEIERYRSVARIIELLKAKARVSLRRNADRS